MESSCGISAVDLELLDSELQLDEKSTTFHIVETQEASRKKYEQTSKSYKWIKRSLDVILSLAALIVLSPVFLITAIAIKLEDGGPVIHRRYCVRKGNMQYIMYKFRSMKVDADDIEKVLTPEQIAEYKKECKLVDDPRVTRIGRVIRRFSIDELPQLVSVLKGDMSLVGPRPMVSFETAFWGKNLERVLEVTPGITGYWQVNGRSDATYESGKRQELEMYYVENRSLKLDIQILFSTIKAVFGGKGAR